MIIDPWPVRMSKPFLPYIVSVPKARWVHNNKTLSLWDLLMCPLNYNKKELREKYSIILEPLSKFDILNMTKELDKIANKKYKPSKNLLIKNEKVLKTLRYFNKKCNKIKNFRLSIGEYKNRKGFFDFIHPDFKIADVSLLKKNQKWFLPEYSTK